MKYYYYFTDLGTGYNNNILTSEYKEYILIYNIKNEDKKENLYLKYIPDNRKIKLSPKIID